MWQMTLLLGSWHMQVWWLHSVPGASSTVVSAVCSVSGPSPQYAASYIYWAGVSFSVSGSHWTYQLLFFLQEVWSEFSLYGYFLHDQSPVHQQLLILAWRAVQKEEWWKESHVVTEPNPVIHWFRYGWRWQQTYYVICIFKFNYNSSIISIIIISRGVQVWIVGIWIKANLLKFIIIKILFWGTFVVMPMAKLITFEKINVELQIK